MANEAVIKVRTSDPIDFGIADAQAVEKGAICNMTDARNTSGANYTVTGEVFGGICAREKIASDGRTQVALYRGGIFDLTKASGAAIVAGEWVTTSGANLIRTATEAEIAAGKSIGIAFETATITGEEVIEVMVGGYN